jgi:hypothetical protein
MPSRLGEEANWNRQERAEGGDAEGNRPSSAQSPWLKAVETALKALNLGYDQPKTVIVQVASAP